MMGMANWADAWKMIFGSGFSRQDAEPFQYLHLRLRAPAGADKKTPAVEGGRPGK
jgi:hypothetical protein